MFSPEDGPAFARAGSFEREQALHPLLSYALPRIEKGNFIHGAEGPISEWEREEIASIRAIYYGMIAEVDAQLGRIWQALKDEGAWENTVIIFTSDHAEMAGDHWMFGKGGFFDGSYHIPLVIRDPKAKNTGQQIDRFTSSADIFPTLCARLGVDPNNHIDGASLLSFVHDGVSEWSRDAAFWEFDFRDISGAGPESHFGLRSSECNLSVLRDKRFKYVHFTGLPPLLFDLDDDPMELINRAEDPAYMAIRLSFAEKLLSLRARHLDQTLAFTELTDAGPVTLRPGV